MLLEVVGVDAIDVSEVAGEELVLDSLDGPQREWILRCLEEGTGPERAARSIHNTSRPQARDCR